MAEGIEYIGRKEVAWSYAATFFTIGAGLILLPFILHKLPAETVGIWYIFQTIQMLVFMLDFGFRPSFTRNISYVFSGVSKLKQEGVEHITKVDTIVDYSLLNATISAMRRFYRLVALAVLLLLITIGSVYMYFISQKYTGDRNDMMVAWLMFIAISSYNMYTFFYDALLSGKGYIKRIQQITIVGQGIYMSLAVILLYAGMGLTAIVSAQLVSVVLRRVLAHVVFYDKEMRKNLAVTHSDRQQEREVMHAIYPNAVKVGLTQLGGFLVNKSALLIGGHFLPLATIGAYGLVTQVLDILARCGCVTYQSYTPRLAQCRASNNIHELKKLYIYSVVSLFAVIAAGGASFVFAGDWALGLIKSDTTLLPKAMLCVMLVICLLEQNHYIAAGFIMADNKIPFFIPSLLSGAATIILIWLFLYVFDMGVWGLILAPGIAQLAYQNWKWPSVIIHELKQAR